MRESGICRGRGSRKKNEEMKRRALEEDEKLEVAHSAFIVLCFRENIFLIFEEFSVKGRRRGRSDQRGRKESIRAKEDIHEGLRREEGYIEEEKYGVSFSVENIFFICKMMREIAIITITEANNNESIKSRRDIRGEGKCFIEIRYERIVKVRGSGIAEEDFQDGDSLPRTSWRYWTIRVDRDAIYLKKRRISSIDRSIDAIR